jgi:hypothetical protein
MYKKWYTLMGKKPGGKKKDADVELGEIELEIQFVFPDLGEIQIGMRWLDLPDDYGMEKTDSSKGGGKKMWGKLKRGANHEESESDSDSDEEGGKKGGSRGLWGKINAVGMLGRNIKGKKGSDSDDDDSPKKPKAKKGSLWKKSGAKVKNINRMKSNFNGREGKTALEDSDEEDDFSRLHSDDLEAYVPTENVEHWPKEPDYLGSWVAEVSIGINQGDELRTFLSIKKLAKMIWEARARVKRFRADTPHSRGEDWEEMEKSETILKRVQAAMDKVHKQVAKSRDNIVRQSVCAFVLFNNAESQRRCLDDYRTSYGSFFGNMFQPRKLRFYRPQRVRAAQAMVEELLAKKKLAKLAKSKKEKKALKLTKEDKAELKRLQSEKETPLALKVLIAPEPSDILWENLELSAQQRRMRIMVTNLITVMLLVATFAMVSATEAVKKSYQAKVPDMSMCDEAVPAVQMGAYSMTFAKEVFPRIDINRTQPQKSGGGLCDPAVSSFCCAPSEAYLYYEHDVMVEEARLAKAGLTYQQAVNQLSGAKETGDGDGDGDGDEDAVVDTGGDAYYYYGALMKDQLDKDAGDDDGEEEEEEAVELVLYDKQPFQLYAQRLQVPKTGNETRWLGEDWFNDMTSRFVKGCDEDESPWVTDDTGNFIRRPNGAKCGQAKGEPEDRDYTPTYIPFQHNGNMEGVPLRCKDFDVKGAPNHPDPTVKCTCEKSYLPEDAQWSCRTPLDCRNLLDPSLPDDSCDPPGSTNNCPQKQPETCDPDWDEGKGLDVHGAPPWRPVFPTNATLCGEGCYSPSDTAKCSSLPCVKELNGYSQGLNKKRCQMYTRSTMVACFCKDAIMDAIVDKGLVEGTKYIVNEMPVCNDLAQALLLSNTFMLVAAMAVVFVNTTLKVILTKLAVLERHNSISAQSKNMTFKIFLAQFLNTALVVLILNAEVPAEVKSMMPPPADMMAKGTYEDLLRVWYVNVGKGLTMTMMLNIFIPHISGLAQVSLVQPLLRCAASGSLLTQDQMNDLYEGPPFQLSTCYPVVLNSLFVTLMYCGGMPILVRVGSLCSKCATTPLSN